MTTWLVARAGLPAEEDLLSRAAQPCALNRSMYRKVLPIEPARAAQFTDRGPQVRMPERRVGPKGSQAVSER